MTSLIFDAENKKTGRKNVRHRRKLAACRECRRE